MLGTWQFLTAELETKMFKEENDGSAEPLCSASQRRSLLSVRWGSRTGEEVWGGEDIY